MKPPKPTQEQPPSESAFDLFELWDLTAEGHSLANVMTALAVMYARIEGAFEAGGGEKEDLRDIFMGAVASGRKAITAFNEAAAAEERLAAAAAMQKVGNA